VAVPRTDEGLLLGLADGLWLTDSDDGPARLLAAIEADDPTTRLNDGTCDRRGRLWAGTMAYDYHAQ
jgi:L-arabinonolactonase